MELGSKSVQQIAPPTTKIKNYAKISKCSCFQSQKKKGDEAGQRLLWKT